MTTNKTVTESNAMTFLAGQLAGPKHFSYERAEESLRTVIAESGDNAARGQRNRTRATVAAHLSVRFADEYKVACAKDSKARQGYKELLRRLRDVAQVEVNRWNPSGTIFARTFPNAAAAIRTPRMVREAEAVISLKELAASRKKGHKKAA